MNEMHPNPTGKNGGMKLFQRLRNTNVLAAYRIENNLYEPPLSGGSFDDNKAYLSTTLYPSSPEEHKQKADITDRIIGFEESTEVLRFSLEFHQLIRSVSPKAEIA